MKKILTLLIVLAFSILPFAADRLITEHLLITEVSVSGTYGVNAEYVEIYNPTSYEIDLTNVYLTDATWTGGPAYYYMIVLGDGGGGVSGDFNAKFPDGASIGAGEYIVIAMAGDDFNDRFGFDADYELFDTGNAAPEMVEATAGSINDQGGITDSGEVIVLYYWDGMTDLVKDLDYIVWGDKNEAVDKTGVFIDGPDAGTDVSTYANDITIDSQTAFESVSGDERYYSATRTDLPESTELKNVAGNGIWGDNEMSEDLSAAFGFYLPSPGEAYDPDTLKATTYLGYTQFPASGTDVETVTVTLYDSSTTFDDILFGNPAAVDQKISVANGVSRDINVIFTGLTEGTSYIVCGWQEENMVTNFWGWFSDDRWSGNHDDIHMYDTVSGLDKEQVYNDPTFTLDWDDYMDTDSGDTADSYLIKISDGNTITEYISLTSDLDVTLVEGTYEAAVLAYNLGDEDYLGASPVAEITVTHFIDKVETIDPNTIKVYYTANLTDIGDFTIATGYAPYAVEFSSGNNWATFVYSDFDFGWGSDYTIEQLNLVNEYGTYSETHAFTVVSPFGVDNAQAADASTIDVTFTLDVDPVTGSETVNYTVTGTSDTTPLVIASVSVLDAIATLNLEAGMPSDDYSVVVNNVVSVDNGPLDAGNSDNFTYASTFEMDYFTVHDAYNIDVVFTEDVDVTSGESIPNYTLVGENTTAPVISNISVAGGIASLELATALATDTYTLTVLAAVVGADGAINEGENEDWFYFEVTSVSLSKVFYLTYSSVELTFTGALDPTTAALTTSYSISTGTISSVAILDDQTVVLGLAADLTKNTSYTFHANATLLAADLIPVNTNSIKELFLFPSITKAEMIDEQTVKIYFNKAMNVLEAGDSWYYFVYAADWSHYSYGGLAVYDHEEYTTTLHLLFPLEMNRDDYYVEGWADYMYGDDVYIHDAKGYNLSQSGDIYAIFSTDINDLELVYSYPSPATGSSITFANLVGVGTISIYTLNGVKIKDIDFDGTSDKQEVILENDSNNDLCSGVYLYRVETDAEGAEVKTGSFAIMK